MGRAPLLKSTDEGLFCEAGGFFIDPWRAVDRAVVTHAHSDHARVGSRHYLAAAPGVAALQTRMGAAANVEGIPFGEVRRLGEVNVSLHPAGHILGSAQIRLEREGEVWVVSGDYKTAPDPTCAAFEPIRCHTFVTESTFGLPIYRWEAETTVFAAIDAWRLANQAAGKATVLFGYSLGKAQRLLAGVDPNIGPIYTHGAVEKATADYRSAGVAMPATTPVWQAPAKTDWSRALIVAPPSANGTPWMRRFGSTSLGFASGWMRIRGARRRRAVDRGFVLSDHADWPGLREAIAATGAERVLVTHGYVPVLVRWLKESGLDAAPLSTPFEGEEGERDAAEPGEDRPAEDVP